MDCYICPENQILYRKKDRKQKEVLYYVYSTDKCKSCPLHGGCTKSRVKEILDVANPLRKELKQYYLSPEGQKYYKKRAPINEGVFGIFKENYQFRALKRRGIKKAQIDLTIRAIIT